jgi:NADPH-dependent curcumin reductase CurA
MNAESHSVTFNNWTTLVSNRLTLKGFSAFDWATRLGEATGVVAKGIQEGGIKAADSEMVVETKFEDIPKTWSMLFDGRNTGKLVTQIAKM